MNDYIINKIRDIVLKSNLSNLYREPLVGFSNADNPLFSKLKSIIHENHKMPHDLLPNAKTVVSFFLPFSESIVIDNQKDDITTTDWAYAKKNTEMLIDEIISKLQSDLKGKGIDCSSNLSKCEYINEFTNTWSQRHVAYICGLGNFGINNMLITEKGCAGRYGSFIMNKECEYDDVKQEEYCLYKLNKSCGLCIKNCPVSALDFDKTDKIKCTNRLSLMSHTYFDDDKVLKSCGKCIALPCALKKPTK